MQNLIIFDSAELEAVDYYSANIPMKQNEAFRETVVLTFAAEYAVDVAAVLAGQKLNKTFPRVDGTNDSKPVATPGSGEFKVRTSLLPLKVYDRPGIARRAVTEVRVPGTFTISEVQNGMGRLKSGKGWIDLSKVERR